MSELNTSNDSYKTPFDHITVAKYTKIITAHAIIQVISNTNFAHLLACSFLTHIHALTLIQSLDTVYWCIDSNASADSV